MAVTWMIPGNYPPTAGAIVYDSRLADALRGLGQTVTFVPIGGMHPLPDSEARESALRQLEEAPPGDMLVIDGFCLYAFAEAAEALHALSAIAMFHHPMSAEPNLPAALRAQYAALEQDLLPRMRHIAVPSTAVRDQLAALPGIAEGAISVMTPGLPVLPRSRGSQGAGCRLLAIGSLIPRKGYGTILAALKPLSDLDWHLTICGDDHFDPDHAARLREDARELGPGRVTFSGPQSAAQLELLWSETDIFVAASQYEGYGMAVAEAVRRGLPLAVTRGAATSEVIPPDGSILVEAGDAVQLSKGLRRVIFDTALRKSLAEAAWQAGRAFPTWEAQASRFMPLLVPTAA